MNGYHCMEISQSMMEKGILNAWFPGQFKFYNKNGPLRKIAV